MPATQSIKGEKFGKLTVLFDDIAKYYPGGRLRYCAVCECDCGTLILTRKDWLKRNNPFSCGCFDHAVNAVHNHCRNRKLTRTYKAWQSMRERCQPDDKHSKDYFERGIKVCGRWLKFSDFLADMGECPPGKELDRWPNNDGNYDPGNCRWATDKEQSRNRRTNRVFTVNGITGCIAELCEFFHVIHWRTRQRLRKGWPIERALFEGLHQEKSHPQQTTQAGP